MAGAVAMTGASQRQMITGQELKVVSNKPCNWLVAVMCNVELHTYYIYICIIMFYYVFICICVYTCLYIVPDYAHLWVNVVKSGTPRIYNNNIVRRNYQQYMEIKLITHAYRLYKNNTWRKAIGSVPENHHQIQQRSQRKCVKLKPCPSWRLTVAFSLPQWYMYIYI